MRFDEDVWKKWREWITRIEGDLLGIVNYQAIDLRFAEIVRENAGWIDSHSGGLVVEFVRRCHATHAIMGVRRHLKRDQDSASFCRVLEQMRDCAPQISFAFYETTFPVERRGPWQRLTFNNFSEGTDLLSPGVFEADLAESGRLGVAIEGLVDRTVAHFDARGFTGTVTYGDIQSAVEHFNRLACKYIALFTGAGQSSLEAKILYDWEEVFRHPLIQPN